MHIPTLAYEKYGGDLSLYEAVYKYSAAFLSEQEIADLLGEPKSVVSDIVKKLKKVVQSLPPDQMTTEALHGYLNMSEFMVNEMMSIYMEMREDREIFRNNEKPNDGKRRVPVHPKDMIALMQTLMKTQLERAAVLTKFAGLHEKQQAALPASKINPNILMDSNDEDIIDVEVKELK